MNSSVQLKIDESQGKNTPQMRQWLDSVHEQLFPTKLERRVDKRREEYMRFMAFDRRTPTVERVDELDLHLHIFTGLQTIFITYYARFTEFYCLGIHASAVLEKTLQSLHAMEAGKSAELPALTQQLSRLIENHRIFSFIRIYLLFDVDFVVVVVCSTSCSGTMRRKRSSHTPSVNTEDIAR
jgi:hypothetical protein